MTILCFFSGGLDSCGMLYKLFTQHPKHDLHIHHISLRNTDDRWKQEKKAVDNCLEWFKDRGFSFKYTENTIDFYFLKKQAPSDFHILAFVTAGMIMENQNYEAIAIGMNKDDKQRISFVPSAPTIVRAIVPPLYKIPPKIYPVEKMTKKEIYNFLPEDLRSLTWSCRTPVNDKPCGNCYTCNELRPILLENTN